MNIDLDAQSTLEFEEWKQLAQTIIIDNTYDCESGFDTEYPHKYSPIAQSIIAKKQ